MWVIGLDEDLHIYVEWKLIARSVKLTQANRDWQARQMTVKKQRRIELRTRSRKSVNTHDSVFILVLHRRGIIDLCNQTISLCKQNFDSANILLPHSHFGEQPRLKLQSDGIELNWLSLPPYFSSAKIESLWHFCAEYDSTAGAVWKIPTANSQCLWKKGGGEEDGELYSKNFCKIL